MESRRHRIVGWICFAPAWVDLLFILFGGFFPLDDPAYEFHLTLLGLGMRVGELSAAIVSGLFVLISRDDADIHWLPWLFLFLLNVALLALTFFWNR